MSRRGLIRGYDREMLREVRLTNAILRRIYPARGPEPASQVRVSLDRAYEGCREALGAAMDGRDKLLPRWRPRHPWMLSRHGSYVY